MTDPLSLPLSQLDRPLKFRSRILNTELWLTPHAAVGKDLQAPLYTVAECRILLALQTSPADLHAIHLTKTVFCGELTTACLRNTLRQRYRELQSRLTNMECQLATDPDSVTDTAVLDIARQMSHLLNQADNLE